MNKPYFYIYPQKAKKNGMCTIFLKVHLAGAKAEINTGVSVHPENWNPDTQTVTVGTDKKDQNLKLKELMGRASGIVRKYDATNTQLTRELLDKELNNPAVFVDFHAFMEDEIKKRRGEIADSTIEQHLSVVSKMKAFRKSLLIIELDEDYLKGFVRHMKIELKNSNPTYSNALKVIKTYSKIAERQGLLKNNPFKYYKVKKEKTVPEFLTEQEVQSLYELYNTNRLPDGYKKVLRWFIFVLNTGVRIGDLRALTFQNILPDGKLSFRPIKSANITNIRVDFPLPKMAKKMVDDEGRQPAENNTLFACHREQTMNEYLKEIAKAAHIRHDISFHTGRHTFATMFLRRTKAANGILILQKILGHSNLGSTIIYSHVIGTDIDAAMRDFEG